MIHFLIERSVSNACTTLVIDDCICVCIPVSATSSFLISQKMQMQTHRNRQSLV